MGRARELVRHVQQELLNKTGTGKARKHRKGARPVGRPRTKGRRPAPHVKRPEVKARLPLHITLRVLPEIRNLRKRDMYRALRHATYVVGGYEDMRIVHISVQREHVHLLVEADNKRALSHGMQGFKISAAKQLNRAMGRRKGQVFAERYFSEAITTPKRARHALAYVLNNWRKHGEDRDTTTNTDPCSSGALFMGWKSREGKLFMWQLPPEYEAPFVWLPQTWLLREGWKRHGLIGFGEVPSRAKAFAPVER